jgi:hypothetical protein
MKPAASPARAIPVLANAAAEQSLRGVAERNGYHGSMADFMSGVCRAYRAAQRSLGAEVSVARLEREPSHKVFRMAAQHLDTMLPAKARILVIGCGADFAGQDSAYAAAMVSRWLAGSKELLVDRKELERRDFAEDGARSVCYDAVVSYSLLHFVAELPSVLSYIAQRLVNGGFYLMAHEPNARYWKNPELLAERQRFSIQSGREDRRRRYLRPSAWGRKIGLLRGKRAPSLEELVNASLREQPAMHSALTWAEVARIIDPHRSMEVKADLRVGVDGFDSDALRTYGFHAWDTLWESTYDHFGHVDYSGLSRSWMRANSELSRRFPLDGSSWSAIWRN